MESIYPQEKIGSIAKVQSGFAFKSSDWQDDGVPVVKIANIKHGFLDLEGCSFVSNDIAANACDYEIKQGDILISMTGFVGEVALVRFFTASLQNQRVGKFHFNNPHEVSSIYFYYCLLLPEIKKEMTSIAYGVAQPNISPSLIQSIEIPFPHLPTQRKIAAILSAYDDLIENNTRRIALLEQMAQAIYREWFVEYRFPGHEQTRMVPSALGMIPEGWEVRKFTEIAEVLSGGTPKTSVEKYWNGEIPFFTPKDVSAYYYVLETEKTLTKEGVEACSSKLYPKNTVFITARGTVGKVVLASQGMAMNQSCYALQGKGSISQYYIFLLTKQMVSYLKKMTHGAVFDTIIADTFTKIQVAIPGLSVLQSFTEIIEPYFESILTMQKTNKTLENRRNFLLPKMISGEVDVSDLQIGNINQ